MHQEALSNRGKEFFPQLRNFDGFYLAGGTALSLQIGHRISVDFDLFTEKDIPKTLLDKAKRIFSGKSINVAINNPDELTFFLEGNKITFLKYPFPVMLGFVKYEGLNLLSVKEIAVTKAYAIGRRGTYKDYVDLYFVINKNYISLGEIMQMAGKKYGNEFNSRLFLEQIIYLEDVDDIEIMFLKEKISRENLRNFFESEIKNLKMF